jgi:hypothetical protein
VHGDARGFRIALTDDVYVNPPPGGLDGLAVLEAAGWGVMQLPAADYPAGTRARILASVADQVQEFARHGYAIVLVGEGAGVDEALAAAGVPAPPRLSPGTAGELRAFLDAAPEPAGIGPDAARAGRRSAGGQ